MRSWPAAAAAAASLLIALAGAPVAAAGAGAPRVLVLGFDGMDPVLLEQHRGEGLMPNFDRLLAEGDLRRLGTSTPPQSPVAWSNFITGQDPGGHGIFDFIHRDPATLVPFLSTSEASPPSSYLKLGPWKMPRGGGEVTLKRDGTAFWELLAAAGVDVTIFKIPSNFPPVECEARSLSGMGTPDILGTYGIFTYYTDDPPANLDPAGGRVVIVDPSRGRFATSVHGPRNTYREGDPEASLPLEVVVDPVHPAASFHIGGDRFALQEGEWSDWVTLQYKMVPLLKTVTGICRFYLMEVRPSFRLYVTPVQIDPVRPEMPISTPRHYARELAEAIGGYYTQGLPDDTKALEEGVFDDHAYAVQSDLVFEERRRQLRYELDRFSRRDSGLLFFYFNTPDQSCHMFWRGIDPQSPTHAGTDPRHAGRIRDLYGRLDQVLGEAIDALGPQTLIMVMSDHGFAPYRRSFHVNSWLLENGYLALRPGVARESVAYLHGIDWSRTRAYAVGINCLYLNLRGREKQGIVQPGREREELLAELAQRLEAVVDPATGQRAIKYAHRSDQIYHGPHREAGPDIVLGYYAGYRGSNESALGKAPAAIFEDNLLKWSGDHCMAADEVPGILACNRPVRKADPDLLDMAPTLLRLFGVTPPPQMRGGDLFADGPGGAAAAR